MTDHWTAPVLDPDEYAVIRGIGRKRYELNSRAGVGNLKVRADLTADPAKFESDTYAAEILVAKTLDLYPDLTQHPRQGGADLHAGPFTLDVKWARPTHYNLATSTLKDEQSTDIYVLVLGDPPALQIAGWCWSCDFIRKENLRPGERGATPYYVYPRTKLRPMCELAAGLSKTE